MAATDDRAKYARTLARSINRCLARGEQIVLCNHGQRVYLTAPVIADGSGVRTSPGAFWPIGSFTCTSYPAKES